MLCGKPWFASWRHQASMHTQAVQPAIRDPAVEIPEKPICKPHVSYCNRAMQDDMPVLHYDMAAMQYDTPAPQFGMGAMQYDRPAL
jgi:hypothetical protein